MSFFVVTNKDGVVLYSYPEEVAYEKVGNIVYFAGSWGVDGILDDQAHEVESVPSDVPPRELPVWSVEGAECVPLQSNDSDRAEWARYLSSSIRDTALGLLVKSDISDYTSSELMTLENQAKLTVGKGSGGKAAYHKELKRLAAKNA